ncbi:hypothetical protein [Lishizhenia sp.]|uniref:hypothetical protein n=1 Tax=Lishizhenia sp. TaxID=2497594 RepID=UPI00299E7D83|nr:hypothetical protein [Lishizhenia sp.]MDX1447225.1 hypothetical protein [Lishizhenia sp.]
MLYKIVLIGILSLAFLPLQVKAQSYFGNTLSIDTSRAAELNIEGMGFYHSSALNRGFLQYFTQGGYISNSEIEDRLSHQKDVNGLGFSLYGAVDLKLHNLHFGEGNKFGVVVSAGSKTMSSLAYTKDLFTMAFQGNANRLGDSLMFNSSSFQLESFQKIGVGVFNRNTNSYLRLNFVGSNNTLNSYLQQSHFYSSANGDSLALLLDGVLKYMDSEKLYSSYGASVDFQYNMPFGEENDKFRGVLSFSVRDLGLVYAKEMTYYNVDTSISFQGANLDNIQAIFSLQGDEVLDSLGIQSEQISSLRFLPSTIEVAKRAELNREDNWQSIFGIRMYPTLVSVPQAYAGAHYRINKILSAGARASFGGFGGFRAGVYFRAHTSNLDIYMASQDIVGLVSKRGFGNSLQFGLGWYF